MSQEKGRILEDAQAGDPVALARALVATPSANPEIEESGAGEAAVAELTAGWLRAWGLAVEISEVAAGRWNVVGRLEGDGVGPTLPRSLGTDFLGYWLWPSPQTRSTPAWEWKFWSALA